MPKHAFHRPNLRTLLSTRRLVVVGAFAAVTCATVAGTAQAAGSAPVALASASALQTASTSVTAAPTTAPSVARTRIRYTVVRGDTLWHIARVHNVPGGWPTIARANHLRHPNLIFPGQVLTLPLRAAAPAAAPAKPAAAAAPAASSTTYTNNLDGWIKHSLAIMAADHIPGTYNGIYRNIMRESSGNPNAINLWDSNAAAGHPSIGLLQVIQPTFNAYHVPGTSWNIYDPVANITAACNYAYHVYGSIDNVNGPY